MAIDTATDRKMAILTPANTRKRWIILCISAKTLLPTFFFFVVVTMSHFPLNSEQVGYFITYYKSNTTTTTHTLTLLLPKNKIVEGK